MRPTNPPGAPIATTPSQIKTVIMTGGTHGLCSEVTKALIDAGHRVVIDVAQWVDNERATAPMDLASLNLCTKDFRLSSFFCMSYP